MRKFNQLSKIEKNMIRKLAEMSFSSIDIAKVFNLKVKSIITLKGNITRKYSWR